MQASSDDHASKVVFLQGNLFQSGQQTLVNPINCKGKMGRGLALDFKNRYPEMHLDYVQRCKDNRVKIGEPYLWKETDDLWILNFPTKNHWNKPSEISYIRQGLQYLAVNARAWGVTSLAIPALGCGLGKLGDDWPMIKELFVQHLTPLGMSIKIYEPKIAMSKKRRNSSPVNDLPMFFSPEKKRIRTTGMAVNIVEGTSLEGNVGTERIIYNK